MRTREPFQPRAQQPIEREPAREVAAFAVRLQRAEPGAHRERMPAIGVAAGQRSRIERGRVTLAQQHAAERRVRRGDALRERDRIGHHAEAFATERSAEPAEARHHLVEDQENAELVAERAHAREVVRRIHDHAVRTDDGFDEQRGDPLRILGRDRPPQVADCTRRLFGGIGRVEGTAIWERRPKAHDAGHHAGFARPAPVLARQRRGAGARTVERTVGGEHFRSARDGARELYRIFVCLRAARREERAAAFARPRRERDELFGEIGARVVEPVRRSEAEFVDLGVHRREHGRMSVAEVCGDETRREIHIAHALGIVHVRAVAAHDRGHVEAALRQPRREDETAMLLRDVVRCKGRGRRCHGGGLSAPRRGSPGA